MMIEVYILLPYIFSFSDVTLTFYQFFLMKKKGIVNHRLELNPIVKYLFKGGPNPIKYIIAIIYTFSLITILIHFSGSLSWMLGVMTGMLLIPNIYHLANIRRYKQFWNDQRYWDITKEIR